jgi:hypothetical protein
MSWSGPFAVGAAGSWWGAAGSVRGALGSVVGLIRSVDQLIRAIDGQSPAASCGIADPEPLWSHVTLGLPAITLRTSPPDTTAGGRSPTTLLDPNSVFFRTSVGESQP